jgi:hypothetical protein
VPFLRNAEGIEELRRRHPVGAPDVRHGHPAGDRGDVGLARRRRRSDQTISQPSGGPAAEHERDDESDRHEDHQGAAAREESGHAETISPNASVIREVASKLAPLFMAPSSSRAGSSGEYHRWSIRG